MIDTSTGGTLKVELQRIEHHEEFDTEMMARSVASYTWDRKALNTVVIDLRGRVSYTDFVVIATGTSDRHVQAVSKHIATQVKHEYGIHTMSREGVEFGQWALTDFGDVILHVFNGKIREEYDLERMWMDAPKLELEDCPADLYGYFELREFE
jgi:ribosome-associated protein